MGKFLSLLIMFLGAPQALALDVSVLEEISWVSSHPILVDDLFAEKTLPKGFSEVIKDKRWADVHPKNEGMTWSRQEVSQKLRPFVMNYNRQVSIEKDKIRLRIPLKIKLLPPHPNLSKNNLKKYVEERLQMQCPECQFDMQFEWAEFPTDLSTKKWSISNEKESWKGKVDLSLIYGDQKYNLPIKIRWKQKIYTAKKNILVGQKLRAEDLILKTQDVTFSNVHFITNSKNATGQLAVKNIRIGQPLHSLLLKKPNLIEYGSLVRASVSGDSFSLSLPAKAKGAGAAGEVISVEILSSKKKVTARIVSSRVVEVL